jgi:hypothetical protein
MSLYSWMHTASLAVACDAIIGKSFGSMYFTATIMLVASVAPLTVMC